LWGGGVSIVKVLPELSAAGSAQMALDAGLLDTAAAVTARRYSWSPPALSLGKFQALPALAGQTKAGQTTAGLPPAAVHAGEVAGAGDASVALPFDIVRRPTGGRAVLHGAEFEWSFAVVFTSAALGAGRRRHDVATPYGIVTGAFAGALRDVGVNLDEVRSSPYQRSRLCFASVLRHDVLARGEKLVAMAQARHGGRVLVHGSVLERRPPDELVRAIEELLGETWQGEGLAGAGLTLAPETIWMRALVRLEAALRGFMPGRHG
jgi:lipoate-protein ligase A